MLGGGAEGGAGVGNIRPGAIVDRTAIAADTTLRKHFSDYGEEGRPHLYLPWPPIMGDHHRHHHLHRSRDIRL